MKNNYWWIVITYIVMQFSGFVVIPFMLLTGWFEDSAMLSIRWTVLSFIIAFLITLFLLKDDIFNRNRIQGQSTMIHTIKWIIFGFFLSLFAQSIAGIIEMYILGVDQESQNTNDILFIAQKAPIFIIVVTLLGPFLEEIVFRYILFGSLYHRFSFFVSALISSVIFALVHQDFPHLLIYISMGFVFAFLYVKTKRIIVPICAHMLMNSFVVVINLSVEPAFIHNLHGIQKLIGG